MTVTAAPGLHCNGSRTLPVQRNDDIPPFPAALDERHRECSTTQLWLALVQAPPQSDLVIVKLTTQCNLVEVDSIYRIDDAHPPAHRDGDRGQDGDTN
jgi:hypothetical protein